MTTIEQRDSVTTQALNAGGGLFGGFFAMLGTGLRGLAGSHAGPSSVAAVAASSSQPSELFARALGDNSNSAMDWLYYAAQLSSATERRYCAGRALLIDSQSAVVRREAARLRR